MTVAASPVLRKSVDDVDVDEPLDLKAPVIGAVVVALEILMAVFGRGATRFQLSTGADLIQIPVLDLPARRVVVVDATPIGANVRSTVATYSGVMDELRRVYARIPDAREAGLKAGDFSYNTGSLRCGHCDGTGQIVLDVQFLPDVDIVCPQCAGSRYGEAAREIRRRPRRRR